MDIKKKKKYEKSSKLQCVVCGSPEIYSEPYKYKQNEKSKLFASAKRGSAFNITLEVPTCLMCRKIFHRWNLYNLGSNGIYILGLVSVIIGICFLIFHQFMGNKGVPLLGFGFLIVIVGLILRYVVGKVGSNPSYYFFYDFLSNSFYIRSKRDENWILYELWIKNVLSERIE